jgi:hypothetical protein
VVANEFGPGVRVSYDEHAVRWSPLWIALWVVNCAALAALLVAGAAAKTWAAAFLAMFLVPELVGLRRHGDGLPPLTYVVCRYVPRWIPTAVTFAVGAWMAFAWLPSPKTEHPLLVAVVIAGMVGWLTNHWDVTYDR